MSIADDIEAKALAMIDSAYQGAGHNAEPWLLVLATDQRAEFLEAMTLHRQGWMVTDDGETFYGAYVLPDSRLREPWMLMNLTDALAYVGARDGSRPDVAAARAFLERRQMALNSRGPDVPGGTPTRRVPGRR